MTELKETFGRGVRAALLAVAVMGMAACEDDVPPPFEIAGTGSVEGLLFLDADRNGLYDPSAGDVLLPDVNVQLFERGTANAIAGASGRTDASGRFAIDSVQPGSHELFVDTVGIGAGVFFCQNPIPVDIFLNETRFEPVAARGGCVITIAEAELRALNTPVTIRGTVTSSVGQTVGDVAYIQDATGGMQIFRISGANTLAIGDVVEVTGNLITFNSEFEVANGRVNERTTGTPVAPKVVTTARITQAATNARDPDIGRLIQVNGAELLTTFSAGGGRNANIDDGSGVAVIRIEAGVEPTPANINTRLTPGRCYNIVGILRQFGTVGQLTPRSYSDIQEVPCT
jgi:hypothetical protein